MVGVTKVQRANASYWIEAVAEGGEDYYTKPGEEAGQWLGELASELGLQGQVDKAAYALLLEGRDPESGAELVHRPPTRTFTDAKGRQRTKEPVLAYDVRFAAPKSVSLLYALGDGGVRDQVVAAYDRAVAAGVRYLEREACFVQRGRGGKVIEPGQGFCAMAFRHRMSRAGDPALHTHVLVSNMTRARSDGRWLSLAAPKGRSALYQHAKAAGYVFQAQLRAELTRELGVEWTQTRNGYADVKGISRPVIEHFSQRRAEITEALALRGVSSAKAAEIAAYRTREAKDYGVDPDQRRAEWAARAQEFDLSRDSIAELASECVPRSVRAIREADLAAAIAGLEQSRSHFDRRDLLCALADRLPEGADLASLSEVVDGCLRGERVLSLGHPADPSQPVYYTTPRLWAAEQRFVEIAREGQGVGAGKVSAKTLAAVLERHPYLGDDQREMVRRLTDGGERIVPVAARPGAGKTTALAAAREAWEAEGHPVIGVATARTASGELADIGVPSTSIAALLTRAEDWQRRGAEPLPRGTVIVMDEASTTSTPDAAALAELVAECEGKLVAIGDPRQIGAVGPGGLYGHLTHTIEPALLTEIRRQQREVDRRIVELAHEGRGSEDAGRDGVALNKWGRRYRRRAVEDLESALRQVPDWLARRKLVDVRRGDVQRLIDEMTAADLSGSRVRSVVNAIRSLYRWAQDRELADHDPAANVRLPVMGARARDRVATPQEFARLLDAIRTPEEADTLPWGLAGYATARHQEIRTLDWAHVDLELGAIELAADEEGRKPGGSWRVVPLVSPLRSMLRRAWIAQSRPSKGKVCPARRRGSRSGLLALGHLQEHVHERWRELGLEPIGLHEARHTAATWLDHAGVTPKVASQLMGHRTPEYQPGAAPITLRRYTHTLPGELERARDLLDAFLTERAREQDAAGR